MSLLKADSVDSIVASFQRAIKRLDRLITTSNQEALINDEKAAAHTLKASALREEVARAKGVAQRLNDLIA